MTRNLILRAFLICVASFTIIHGQDNKEISIDNEWKQKRENIFEFAEKPSVSTDGDQTIVSFETKSFCDVTIAIENHEKKIVRHLASGVLGQNAPRPFIKNSKKQQIIWDGKNDQGSYVDNKESCTVRISLGLKPQLERTLYWSPKRRAGNETCKGIAMHATPDGVYVYDGGQAIDHIRLFSHKGEYLRTVYPFPSQKIQNIKGLLTAPFPQDEKILPIKQNYLQSTFLRSGDNGLNLTFEKNRYIITNMDPAKKGQYGSATNDIAIHSNVIAFGANRLHRITTDGSETDLYFNGPWISQRNEQGFYKPNVSALAAKSGGYDKLTHLKPSRLSFSPNGETLYLTRYIENFSLDSSKYNYWQHGVYKMIFKEDKEPQLFLGKIESGKSNEHFNMPADVVCDSKGRVCIADMGNNRIQVFSSEGNYIKTISVEAPVQISFSPTDELYVFSWELLTDRNSSRIKISKPYVMRKFKSIDDPKLLASYNLPIAETRGKLGQIAEIDFWTETPTLWLHPGLKPTNAKDIDDSQSSGGISLFAIKANSLEFITSFEESASKTVLNTMAPENNRQRLYWDPKKELLFVGEGSFYFQETIAIQPENGHVKKVTLPFDAEDMCFDINGFAYLRTENILVRYETDTWKEIPFDYGIERNKVTYNPNSGRRSANVISGINLPVNVGWHQGGIHVAPNGNIVAGCLFDAKDKSTPVFSNKYTPLMYHGRVSGSSRGCEYIHVWDKFGKLVVDDSVKGLGHVNGVAIDNENNIYVLSTAPRANNNLRPFNYLAGTLMKFQLGSGKIISESTEVPLPLPKENAPQKHPDLLYEHNRTWVENADWFYGGVGWHSKNNGSGCGCFNTRFSLDYFGRSFAPENDRYSIAVIDTSGNLILRIGTYGNIDDGKPLISDGGPQNTKAIGGDEVAIMLGSYLAVQSDRRLFIADIGNYRIASVALNYYHSESISLSK